MNESVQDQPRKIRPAALAGLLIFFILLSAGATLAIYRKTLNKNSVTRDAQASPLTPLGENPNDNLPQTGQEPININNKVTTGSNQKIQSTTITPTPAFTPPVRQPTTKPVPQPTLIYACDPYGTCGVYSDPKSKGCPNTYNNTKCSDQCTKTEVRCKL